MARLGFGELIARARSEAGLSHDELARRLGYRSASSVYRLESEEQEPDVRVVNALVAALPLSAEQLLKAMGVNLAPARAQLLPLALVEDALALDPEHLSALALSANALLAHQRRQAGDRPSESRRPSGERQ